MSQETQSPKQLLTPVSNDPVSQAQVDQVSNQAVGEIASGMHRTTGMATVRPPGQWGASSLVPSQGAQPPKEDRNSPSETGSVFDEDYYMRGPETHKSNYQDYKWLPDVTLPMVDHVMRFLGIKHGESLLSFGCARGFDVKGFRMRRVNAQGYDISEWAIANCDPSVKDHVSCNDHYIPGDTVYDYLYSKDCLEHIHPDEISAFLPRLLNNTRKKALIIVPLTREHGGGYLNPLDEKDSTHIIRWPLTQWLYFLQNRSSDFVVSGSVRVPLLKASSELYPGSAGFITLQRF